MNRTPLYAVVLAVFCGLCIYAAVGVWLGVAQAVGGARVPGVAVGVHCAYTRGTSCGGEFTSDDGTIRRRHVRVEGVSQSRSAVHGTFVPRISNGLDGAIQSDDTVYVGDVRINVIGSVVIGVVLSILGLGLVLPLLLGLLTVGARLRRGRPGGL